MTISDKIKTIDNKIEQNFSKYEFLTDKYVLPENYLLKELLQ